MCFDEEELKTLCFYCDVNCDVLRSQGKAAKACELLAHCQRRDKMEQLIAQIREQRPAVLQPDPGNRLQQAVCHWLSDVNNFSKPPTLIVTITPRPTQPSTQPLPIYTLKPTQPPTAASFSPSTWTPLPSPTTK